jgi:hypothetical protein
MIISDRTLEIRTASHAAVPVPIQLFAPVENGKSWSCRYQITWPEKTRAMSIHGIDAMQAVVLALQTIGAELYASKYHENGTLVFHRPGGGYGFPVPAVLRDALIGDDKADWA